MLVEIKENLWIDKEKMLVISKPDGKEQFIVLNSKSALMYGPDNIANCKRFISEYDK